MSARSAIPTSALVLLAAALVACRDRGETTSSTPSVDLLDRLDDADVRCPALDRLARGAPPDARTLRVDESFDEGIPADWIGDAAAAGPDPDDGRSVAFVAARSGRLVRTVGATGGAAHVVTARVRVLAEPDDGPADRPALWVRALLSAPTREELESGGAADVIAAAGPWRTATLGAGGPAGWRDLAVVLTPPAAFDALELALVGGDVGMLVDEVRVQRLGALERAALDAPAAPVTPALLRARVDVHQERRAALLLPGESRVTFDVHVPGRRARLDTATTLLPGARDAATLRVLVDGEEVASREEQPAPFSRSRFRPWVVPLDRFAGERVELALAVSAPPDGEVAWGTPRLLGTPDARPGPNLVLVSLDTLRADMVGAIDPPGRLTPHLDAFAAEGTAFARALTLGAYTLPSHATMMTGQHPLEHGVNKAPERLDARRSPLLARRLAERGWLTAAFTGGGFVDPRFGFDEGFSVYSTRDPGLTGEVRHVSKRAAHVLDVPRSASTESLQPVLEHLGRVDDQPFFLFVHTYVVHNYLPHREFLEEPEVRPELADVPGDELYRRASEEFDSAAAARLEWLYRATVRQVDALFVRPLLRRLDELGRAGDTVVAFVADHGEQFLEHGEFGHFGFLWAENVRVPLLLRGPGVPAGRRVDEAVTLRDLAPTLTRLLGVPDDPRVTGVPLLGPGAAVPRERDVVWRHPVRWSAYVHGDWKLVRDGDAEGDARSSLFRFDVDARDEDDLSAQRPHVVREMLERFEKRESALRASAPAPTASEDATLDAEIEARLRALGYLGDG